MCFPRKHLLPLFLLTLGVIHIYSNSLDGDFLFDDQQILDRPNLHITDLSVKSIKGTFYFTPKSKKIYRPLPNLSLGLNYNLSLAGKNTGAGWGYRVGLMWQQ